MVFCGGLALVGLALDSGSALEKGVFHVSWLHPIAGAVLGAVFAVIGRESPQGVPGAVSSGQVFASTAIAV